MLAPHQPDHALASQIVLDTAPAARVQLMDAVADDDPEDGAGAIIGHALGREAPITGTLPSRRYPFDNSDIEPTEGGQTDYASPAEPLPEDPG